MHARMCVVPPPLSTFYDHHDDTEKEEPRLSSPVVPTVHFQHFMVVLADLVCWY